MKLSTILLEHAANEVHHGERGHGNDFNIPDESCLKCVLQQAAGEVARYEESPPRAFPAPEAELRVLLYEGAHLASSVMSFLGMARAREPDYDKNGYQTNRARVLNTRFYALAEKFDPREYCDICGSAKHLTSKCDMDGSAR